MQLDPPVATQGETIGEILARSKRNAVPIRKTFVQQGAKKVRDPGPVSLLLTTRNARALDLYLLIHAIVSKEPFNVTLPAEVWARAMGLPDTESSRTAVSKALRRLEELQLIAKARKGNLTKITVLDESGHGNPYTLPYKNTEPYLKLPHQYWTEEWHERLSLPGKVMLLIALSLDDHFSLPAEKGKDWYNVSGDTVQRGLAELRDMTLLHVDFDFKKAPLAPKGYTKEYRYTLRPPFGPMRAPLAPIIDLHPKAGIHG